MCSSDLPGSDSWSGVLIDRGEKKPTFTRLRLAGDAREQRDGATRLLVAAIELYLWAMRDAVPLFDRASEALANGNLDAAETKLTDDLLDQWITALWPSMSLERLRVDPLLSTDPDILGMFETRPPSSSRAELVAKWLWRTYSAVIVEDEQRLAVADSSGNVIDAAFDNLAGSSWHVPSVGTSQL